MSRLTDVIERLRLLIFRRREERELDEELRLHLDMQTEHERRKGIPASEACRRALVALGGVEQIKEDARDARGTRLVEDAVRDVGYAIRTLTASPGFTLAVVLTLAVGIGGTTAIFGAVDAVLLAPLPYAQPGQLVRIYQNGLRAPNDRGVVTPVHYLAFRDHVSAFESTAALYTYSESGADIGDGGDVRRIRVLPISASYFDVVRTYPALGHAFPPGDNEGPSSGVKMRGAAVVILSDRLWRDRFRADPAAVGGTVSMSGVPHVIEGVMPPKFSDPVAGDVDAWVPLNLTPGRDAGNADNHYLSVIARLRSGITIETAQSELTAQAVQLGKIYPGARESGARLYPLKADLVGSSSLSLKIMLGAVGLVLLLVCVNVANLMLVRGADRAREFAVRASLGAGRARLVRQLLVESLTLAIAGALAGLVVARLAMSAIRMLGADAVPRLTSLSLNPGLFAFALGVATASAVLFGLIPAIRAARTQPGDVLRLESRSATSGRGAIRLREWLVVSQVALAVVLSVGSGLLLMSVKHIRDVDLGVHADGVLTFELNLPDARYDATARARFYEAFAADLTSLPGVRAAGGVSKLPATGPYNQWGTRATSGPLAGDQARGQINAQNRIVSGDYFRAVEIPLIEGRTFDATDTATAPQRVVVSRSLADRLYPQTTAIGQTLSTGGGNCTIVGVVGDVSVDNEGRPAPYVYHAHVQYAADRNWPLMQVVATTGDAVGLEPAVRRVLAARDPQLIAYRPMGLDEAIGRGAAARVLTLKLLAIFTGIALSLAALGLSGVLGYGVRARTREFGIRLALGAARTGIVGIVLRQGLVIVGLGAIVGVGAALALSRVMTALLFRVSPLDLRALIGAVALMAMVGAIAAGWPAWRAARVELRSMLQ